MFVQNVYEYFLKCSEKNIIYLFFTIQRISCILVLDIQITMNEIILKISCLMNICFYATHPTTIFK